MMAKPTLAAPVALLLCACAAVANGQTAPAAFTEPDLAGDVVVGMATESPETASPTTMGMEAWDPDEGAAMFTKDGVLFIEAKDILIDDPTPKEEEAEAGQGENKNKKQNAPTSFNTLKEMTQKVPANCALFLCPPHHRACAHTPRATPSPAACRVASPPRAKSL